jgi:FixJ family two-component response regulator
MASAFCVYVVDDDESVRKALSRLLCASGYQVKAYAQGEQSSPSWRPMRWAVFSST